MYTSKFEKSAKALHPTPQSTSPWRPKQICTIFHDQYSMSYEKMSKVLPISPPTPTLLENLTDYAIF